MSSKPEEAAGMFLEGYNCAQAVAGTLGPEVGFDRVAAIKAAQALGGGMARTGGVCGAISGALLLIGFKITPSGPSDAVAKQEAYRIGREVMARFKARYGSVNCRDLLGCDISTPEGAKHFAEQDMHHTVCPKFVSAGAEIVQALLKN